jgi:hypothetical protein
MLTNAASNPNVNSKAGKLFTNAQPSQSVIPKVVNERAQSSARE